MNQKLWIVLGSFVLVTFLAVNASAQQTTGTANGQSASTQTGPAKNPNATPVIDKREHNEKRRMKRGVKSGELTKHETKELVKEQKEIRKDEKEAKSDGTVTKEERKEIRMEEKQASKDIYKQKHDAQKRPKARKKG